MQGNLQAQDSVETMIVKGFLHSLCFTSEEIESLLEKDVSGTPGLDSWRKHSLLFP